MKQYQFRGQLNALIIHAQKGQKENINYIMSKLTSTSSLATTRYIDYALSLVQNESGIDQIKHFLFEGTQIQRNYASLFFNRRGDWQFIKEAYEKGLIDKIQAFAR